MQTDLPVGVILFAGPTLGEGQVLWGQIGGMSFLLLQAA